jgi:hypothetical protein
MISVLLPALAACELLQQEEPLPEKISGVWELHQEESTTGQVDAIASILDKYPGCTWGRMTWTFDEDHLSLGLDVLCPAGVGDYYGCEVKARVPAVWHAKEGKFTVDAPVAARSRTVGIAEDAIPGPTKCEVSIAAGDYPVVRVRNQDWRWEMRTPNGKVFRLRLPRSDRPDFVSAIQSGGEATP